MPLTTRLATHHDIPQLNELIALSVRGLSTEYYTPNQIESAIKYIFGIDTQLMELITSPKKKVYWLAVAAGANATPFTAATSIKTLKIRCLPLQRTPPASVPFLFIPTMPGRE